MPRMIDLVRTSRLPSNLMQFAACGALSAPPGETIEILVHLALHNNLFGKQAGLTLAGWDEKASRAAAADPQTSPEVLRYFVDIENLRTCLLPALAENPSVSEESLDRAGDVGSAPDRGNSVEEPAGDELSAIVGGVAVESQPATE